MLHYTESGKKIKPEDLSKRQSEKINTVPLLRYYTVFNIQDVEGINPDLPGQFKPNDPIADCEQIVTGMNNRPEIIRQGDKTYYQLSKYLVCLPVRNNFKSSKEYYSTLFHELSHSTGHPSRLNRKVLSNRIPSVLNYIASRSSLPRYLLVSCAMKPVSVIRSWITVQPTLTAG